MTIVNKLKSSLPLSFRDYFRPHYLKVTRKITSSYLWPKPSDWQKKKIQLNSLRSTKDYYRFAQEEFGIIQVHEEIIAFLEFAKNHKPKIVCEIGMKNGGNSFLFMHVLTTLKLMISLDLMIKNEGKLRYFSTSKQKLICISGTSQSQQSVAKVKKALKGNKLDLLFIDGDHSYNGVKQDFIQYKPLVKDGGLIVFHDIVPDHFTKYGRPKRNQWDADAGEVYKFWEEVKNNFTIREFVANPEQNGFGIGVIVISI